MIFLIFFNISVFIVWTYYICVKSSKCDWTLESDLRAGQLFSLCTPVSSTNEIDHQDITEILLKVTLNTITLIPTRHDIDEILLKLALNINQSIQYTCTKMYLSDETKFLQIRELSFFISRIYPNLPLVATSADSVPSSNLVRITIALIGTTFGNLQ